MNSHAKIIFNPCENKENKYINILVSGLEKSGFQINPLDDFLSSKAHYRSIQLLHLNWFENLDDTSKRKMWTSYFRKLVVLLAVKIGKKKLVWTMHNRLTHEKKSAKLSRMLTERIVDQSDAIVIHSTISKKILQDQFPNLKSKIVYIPHPDFIQEYGSMLPDLQRRFSPQLKLLFLGAIKPYKNIEMLIQMAKTFPNEIHLTIAGNPNTIAYKNELEDLAKGIKNLRLELKFVSDSEIPTYIHESDLLVLPYSLESSLNSGTAILAFSYGRSVICPRIGTLEDLDAGEDIFDYQYQNEAEHFEALTSQIQKAIQVHLRNPNELIEKGKRMRELVAKKNNKQLVVEKLIELYNSLLG